MRTARAVVVSLAVGSAALSGVAGCGGHSHSYSDGYQWGKNSANGPGDCADAHVSNGDKAGEWRQGCVDAQKGDKGKMTSGSSGS